MLRIIFMGTPDFAIPTLSEIIGQGHEVIACYTQPPRPAGRGMDERRSPIHNIAANMSIPVYTPISLNGTEQQTEFASHNADVAVVVAYGLLLPQHILQAPTNGCINLHASLLPRWRGAAPINRAIMAGDKETGVMVIRMEEGLDTGPIAMAEKTIIGINETAGELHDRLSRLGADLTTRALSALSRDLLSFTTQQEEGACYAHKIHKQNARIDWSQTAQSIHNHIRGLSPFPGAWCEMTNNDGNTQRVKILRSEMAEDRAPPNRVSPGIVLDENLTIACGEGAIRVLEAQRAGKEKHPTSVFLRGFPITKGDIVK